jgi:hypothetical protein
MRRGCGAVWHSGADQALSPAGPEGDPPDDDEEAPETPLDEPPPTPIEDPPAEPDTSPYVVRAVLAARRPALAPSQEVERDSD